MPLAERFVGWFVGTFFFYWWHRLRHAKGWWLVFHQIHHSASRIELVTSQGDALCRGWRIRLQAPRVVLVGSDPTQSLHPSVRQRWEADASYRPASLCKYFEQT